MIDAFLRMEEEYGLLSDKIDGFQYWIYIRDKVYAKICNLEPNIKHNESIMSKLDNSFGTSVLELSNTTVGLKEIISVIKNCTIGNPLRYRDHKDILIFPSPRRTLIDGKYYAYWTDEIADYYNDKSVTAEFLNITTHSRPYWNDNVIEMDIVDIWPVVLYKANIIYANKVKKMVKNKCLYINDLIQKCMNRNLGEDYLINLIASRYIWWKVKKRYLLKFIKQISPKIIIEVSSYSTNKLVINEIASELKICTIEMQHGIIGSEHIGYNYLAERYYPSLPNKLLVFSDYWKNTCRFPIGRNNIIPVGYPYAEMQKKKYPKVESKDSTVRILILSQPIFHLEFLSTTREIIHILNESNIDYSLSIKLHPTEYNQPTEEWDFINEYNNICLIRNSDIPLYSLFANSDIQIGATSTTLFEGLIYNLYTIICNFGNAESRMKDLCTMNYAHFSNNSEEVVDLIKRWSNNAVIQNDGFFISDGLNHIIREIDSLLY